MKGWDNFDGWLIALKEVQSNPKSRIARRYKWRNLRALVWRGEWDYRELGILDSAHVRFYTYKSLIKMFQKLGYEIITIEGIHPTRNKKFKVLNFLLWNKLWDAKYSQFACVIKPVGKR